ncbi:hypothetical protein O3P69_013520 [Scylla paramamosain]|uniref:Uncharacterized protein n=1 Tax=Scylla paramamosain TaxID=85552 RepID=A0AAW0S9H6_SCYPA
MHLRHVTRLLVTSLLISSVIGGLPYGAKPIDCYPKTVFVTVAQDVTREVAVPTRIFKSELVPKRFDLDRINSVTEDVIVRSYRAQPVTTTAVAACGCALCHVEASAASRLPHRAAPPLPVWWPVACGRGAHESLPRTRLLLGAACGWRHPPQGLCPPQRQRASSTAAPGQGGGQPRCDAVLAALTQVYPAPSPPRHAAPRRAPPRRATPRRTACPQVLPSCQCR